MLGLSADNFKADLLQLNKSRPKIAMYVTTTKVFEVGTTFLRVSIDKIARTWYCKARRQWFSIPKPLVNKLSILIIFRCELFVMHGSVISLFIQSKFQWF